MFEYLYNLVFGELEENINWCSLQQHRKYLTTMQIKMNNVKKKRASIEVPKIMNFTIQDQLDRLDYLRLSGEMDCKFGTNDGYVSL